MALSDAVQNGTVARVIGIEFPFRDLRGDRVFVLPQHVAVIAQGNTANAANYTTDPTRYFDPHAVGLAFGFGSPAHAIAKRLWPVNGRGVGNIPVTFFGLKDDGSGVIAAGQIDPAGSADANAVYTVTAGGVTSKDIVVPSGTAIEAIVDLFVAGINEVVDMPVIAVKSGTGNDAVVALTAKWDGPTGNYIHTRINLDRANGSSMTFTVTQLTNGAADPDADTALNQFSENMHYTVVINGLEATDANYTKYETVGAARRDALVRKRMVVISGDTEQVVATAITVPDARTTDETNVQVNVPGSLDTPWEIAAAVGRSVAVVANDDPAKQYARQSLADLQTPPEGSLWGSSERQAAFLGGVSTVTATSGILYVSDIITMYHPTGEAIPGKRKVCDLMKLTNIMFNFDLVFLSPEWDGAPLIPNGQVTSNRNAKSPADFEAAVASIYRNAGLQAWISDPDTAIDTIRAQINDQNPNRVDVTSSFKISGNTDIQSHTHNYSVFLGEAA